MALFLLAYSFRENGFNGCRYQWQIAILSTHGIITICNYLQAELSEL